MRQLVIPLICLFVGAQNLKGQTPEASNQAGSVQQLPLEGANTKGKSAHLPGLDFYAAVVDRILAGKDESSRVYVWQKKGEPPKPKWYVQAHVAPSFTEDKPLPQPHWKQPLPAHGVLNPEVLQDCFSFNHEWIAAKPRTTHQIGSALLPQFDTAGMTHIEIFQCLNASLWEAGFRPDGNEENPRWSLPLDQSDLEDSLGDLWGGDPTDDFKS